MSAKYEWRCVTENAAFAARDGAGALVFQDKMWLLGGWNPGDKVHFPLICNSEVWSSADGASWTLENPQAPWEGRHTAGYVVHNDRMWIVGGDCNQGHYQNDVWSSADGIHWDLANDHVPWAPRVLHYTLAFDGRIWVMGGQTIPNFADADEVFHNDVWSSDDGVKLGPSYRERSVGAQRDDRRSRCPRQQDVDSGWRHLRYACNSHAQFLQ